MNIERTQIIEELKDRLFDIFRWPHYQIMFDHMDKIIEQIEQNDKLALLERCYIYNGYSIFSSLFKSLKLDIYDFIPPNSQNQNRHNYQFDKLNSLPKTKANLKKAAFRVNIENLRNSLVFEEKYNYIFIPNVLHHYPNPFELIGTCYAALKKGGNLYIFDATLRENHQKPDDFIRFTTDGITYCLENTGFEILEIASSKSPLEALTYTMDQVLQYDIPDDLKLEIKKLNDNINNKYRSNLRKNFDNKVRKYTSFPVAYSVLARKK